jgi:hypothetical protein
VLHYVTAQQQAAMLSSIDVFWLLALIFGALARVVFLMRKPGLEPRPPAHRGGRSQGGRIGETVRR